MPSVKAYRLTPPGACGSRGRLFLQGVVVFGQFDTITSYFGFVGRGRLSCAPCQIVLMVTRLPRTR